MSQVSTQLESWEAQGKEIAGSLRTELKELEGRKAEILSTLSKLEGKNGHTGGGRRANGARSECGRLVRQVVTEAGPEGLQADEIILSVQAESEQMIARATILTHLSRLKKSGTFQFTGEAGAYTYICAPKEEATE